MRIAAVVTHAIIAIAAPVAKRAARFDDDVIVNYTLHGW